MAKKSRRKTCKAGPTVAPEFDEVHYEAENQVRSTFMETPGAKKLVRKTEKSIRRQRAETKRDLKKGMK